jgi:hypothetical protein
LVSINVVPTSHRYLPEDTRTQVLQLEILVRKLGTIDRLSTISITSCYISTLNPEVIILPFGFFDTMEWRSLVMQWLARYADSFLACKQSIVGYIIKWNDCIKMVCEKSNVFEFTSTFLPPNKTDKERDSPVQSARKFSAVFGTTSARRTISMRPADVPPIVISKKQTGFALFSVVARYMKRRRAAKEEEE